MKRFKVFGGLGSFFHFLPMPRNLRYFSAMFISGPSFDIFLLPSRIFDSAGPEWFNFTPSLLFQLGKYYLLKLFIIKKGFFFFHSVFAIWKNTRVQQRITTTYNRYWWVPSYGVLGFSQKSSSNYGRCSYSLGQT